MDKVVPCLQSPLTIRLAFLTDNTLLSDAGSHKMVTLGKKYGVRRYGKETYYTKDVLLNGIPIGTLDGWHSEFVGLKKNPAFLHDCFKWE
jgi:hypothetical protein